jgi:uncharacterized membrane protein YczE
MCTAALRVHVLRAALVALGTAVSTYGYLLTVASRVGNGPLFAIHDGLHRRLDVPLGVAAAAVGLVLVAGAAALRAPLGPSTVAIPLLTGLAVEVLEPLVVTPTGPALRWVGFLAGTAVMMLGAVVALGASAGAAAIDGVMLGLSERLGTSAATTRLAMELGMALTGAWLGGRVGVGTLVMGASVGPLFAFWSRRLRRWGLPLPAGNRTEARSVAPTPLG